MKKTIGIFLVILVMATLVCAAFTGCEFSRKMKGAEMTFPGKVSGAKKLSFKMNINYKKGDVTTVIDMDCYRAANEAGQDEYAYVYSTPSASVNSYKNVYADGKLYEFVNVTQNAGSYYVKEDVSVEDEGNILYHVTKKILLTSAAALVSKAQKETLRGEETYRYDVSISGKDISLWYNSEVLVQIYVAFAAEDGGQEEYTIALSDYNFDGELPADAFKRPNEYGITYIPSPISFEDWTLILTSFASKLG